MTATSFACPWHWAEHNLMELLPEAPFKADDPPTDLLAELSQELRSPLNTILGFATLLKDPELSQKDQEQFIDRILSNGDDLLQILDDALNLSKIPNKAPNLEQVSFNIVEMIYDVVQTLKPMADKKELDIHLKFKTSIPETVVSDPLKVRQILNHLFASTIRSARDDGFILISLSFDSENQQPQLLIEIDDSGAKPEVLVKTRKILRPGFSLSQKFAQLLGGRLTVRPSEFGEGDCFTFSVPCRNTGNVKLLTKRKTFVSSEKTESSPKKTRRLKNIKVLSAEDSIDNETIIRLFLSKEGALLTYVHNGLEAVEAVKNGEFDIILMDIQMPLVDGLEATRQIRHLGFQKPIIALTGKALRDDAEKSLKAGCDTHLTKPIRKELLIQEIEKRVVLNHSPSLG